MDWKTLVDNASQYGFLGPIVGIAGLLIGAGSALLFGWTKTLDSWKPPEEVLPVPLGKVITLLCALGIFTAWLLAEPSNRMAYLHGMFWLIGCAVVAFLVYVGLRTYCGRFSRPIIDPATNKQTGTEPIWGGFWLTDRARKAKRAGTSVDDFLAGNFYKKTDVWPDLSLATSAVVGAAILLAALVCGTSALATAATTAQVVLTKKPAREVFSSKNVPGLPSQDGKPTEKPTGETAVPK
jgi:hypothetical protein